MSEVAPSTDATAAKQVTQDATVEAKTFTWVTPSIWPDNKVLDILADPKEAEKLEKMSSKEIKALATNNDEVSDLFTKRSMSFNRKEMVEKRRCVECLFVRKLCICERIAAISKNISQPDLDNYNTEVWIFMRVDEFGSTSNTGRLLPMILPKHTKLFIFGIKAHEKALLDHIKAAENPVVLYPSENAMPVAEYVAKQQSEAAAKAGVEQSENTSARKRPKVTMIVLEGTWSKVKPMQRFIPKEVPRVILAPDAINDKRSVRRESRSGGCATLEAILAGLRQLEEPQSILTAIGDGFDTLLNGALRQGNLIGDKGEFRGVHHQHMADFHEESQRKKLKLSSETESVSEAKSADTQTAEIATGNETVPSESVTESKLDAVPADTTK